MCTETQLLHKSKKRDSISFDISTKNTDCQVGMAQSVEQAIAAQKKSLLSLGQSILFSVII